MGPPPAAVGDTPDLVDFTWAEMSAWIREVQAGEFDDLA